MIAEVIGKLRIAGQLVDFGGGVVVFQTERHGQFLIKSFVDILAGQHGEYGARHVEIPVVVNIPGAVRSGAPFQSVGFPAGSRRRMIYSRTRG